MKIKFLGTGGAFVLGHENYHSNIVISKDVEMLTELPYSTPQRKLYVAEKQTKHLLYDAGSTIGDALNDDGLTPIDLDSIYISHLHADHAGGIEYIAFKTYFEQLTFGENKVNLLGHHDILEQGWEQSWQGGLKSIQGRTNTLETYFNTKYLANNDTFDYYGTTMKPVQSVHVVDDRRIVPSYGLMFEDNGTTVYITGDSQFSPNQMITYFEQSDIIFHDCEWERYPNSVHAQFHHLCTLPDYIKSKMWLYHYTLKGRNIEELLILAEDEGFAGVVQRGQEFNTEDII